MNMIKHALAAAVALATIQAHALSTTVTAGPTSTESGAVTIDFDSAPPAGWSYSGGALFTTSIGGITAVPPGSTGNFWSVGPSGDQDGPGVVTLVGGASYYGFLWGSPDGYNTVSFYDGATLLGSFTGAAVYPPANGDQSIGRFFNAFAGAGETITRIEFASSQNAFETDNHAVIAVPEPETYALMLAGLGVVGFVARRRAQV
jgi:hypothetical protein